MLNQENLCHFNSYNLPYIKTFNNHGVMCELVTCIMFYTNIIIIGNDSLNLFLKSICLTFSYRILLFTYFRILSVLWQKLLVKTTDYISIRMNTKSITFWIFDNGFDYKHSYYRFYENRQHTFGYYCKREY